MQFKKSKNKKTRHYPSARLPINTHRKNMFRKTGTKSILELVQLGLEKGWL